MNKENKTKAQCTIIDSLSWLYEPPQQEIWLVKAERHTIQITTQEDYVSYVSMEHFRFLFDDLHIYCNTILNCVIEQDKSAHYSARL